MRLNAPTIFIFLISLIIAGLGVAGHIFPHIIPDVFPNQDFWLAVGGYVVLMFANLLKGL